MTTFLKQSTAVTVVLGPFVDDTDFKTPETGLTISQADIRLSKNGAAFAQTNNAAGATAMEGGDYSVPLDTTDTNTLGTLRLRVNESGALAVWRDFMVMPANVWDSLFGADRLQVDVQEMGAGVITSTVIASNAIGSDEIASTAAVEIAAAVWDRVISVANHNIVDSAGRTLRTLSTNIAIRTGTAQAGAASTITLDSGASSTNDIYNGAIVVITGGTGVGQSRRIVDYVGATKVATVDRPWVTNPSATSTFAIYASTRSIIADEGIAQAGAATTITLASTASTSDSIYNGAIVTITSGTGSGQTREISSYVGATRVATVDSAWSVTPDSTSVYAVIPNVTAAGDSLIFDPDSVWDVILANHLTTGTTGAALNGIGGDPWNTALPGAYASGKAGNIVGSLLVRLGQIVIKKGVAVSGFQFSMKGDDGAPRAGLTVTAKYSLDGGAFATSANSVVEIGEGWYKIDMTSSETNGTVVAWSMTASGAAPRHFTMLTQPTS